MIHNLDIANGSWYSPKGDHGYSHFVGDRAGEIVIRWEDGAEARVPLVFGYNLWYGKAWDNLWHYLDYVPGRGGANFDATLFDGHDEHRRVIETGLALADGYRLMGSDSCNARFIFTVDLGGRSVRSIDVAGVPELYDFPLISAITFEMDAAAPPSTSPSAPLARLSDPTGGVTGLRAVTVDSIQREAWRAGVETIQRVLYTFVDELPKLSAPSRPDGYFGPGFDFQGNPLATYAATYLYWNGPECSAYIADDGTGLLLLHRGPGPGPLHAGDGGLVSEEVALREHRELASALPGSAAGRAAGKRGGLEPRHRRAPAGEHGLRVRQVRGLLPGLAGPLSLRRGQPAPLDPDCRTGPGIRRLQDRSGRGGRGGRQPGERWTRYLHVGTVHDVALEGTPRRVEPAPLCRHTRRGRLDPMAARHRPPASRRAQGRPLHGERVRPRRLRYLLHLQLPPRHQALRPHGARPGGGRLGGSVGSPGPQAAAGHPGSPGGSQSGRPHLAHGRRLRLAGSRAQAGSLAPVDRGGFLHAAAGLRGGRRAGAPMPGDQPQLVSVPDEAGAGGTGGRGRR